MILTRLADLPDWSNYDRIGLDTETCDPTLKKLGPSVRRGGFMVGISFATPDGQSFYLPIRHEASGNYENPENVLEYLRHQAKHFSGDIVGTNLPYDLDYLAEDGVVFKPRFFRDISVSGPLLIEPEMIKADDPENPGRTFWTEKVQLMNLNAQAQRLEMAGKDETELNEWAKSVKLNPKADMWKAPPARVEKYACVDAELPLAIMEQHEKEIDAQGLRRVFDLESKLLPVLLKMRRRGVRVDLSKLGTIEARATTFETLAMREVSRISGVELTGDDINTSAALAMALKADGEKVPKTKKGTHKTTGKPTGGKDSVTSPWLRGLGTPLAAAILQAKKWNKIRTTFCESIKNHAIEHSPDNVRIHCTFNQLRQEQDDGEMGGAQFGRLSSSNPNLQQQPARDPIIGPLWRSIYLPDEGGRWACLDFSSQEPRMITHYAELMANSPQTRFESRIRWDQATRNSARAAADACRTDPNWDNHSMMASFIFGDEYSADDYRAGCKKAKGLRDQSKTIFLGKCYGMGGGKLCRGLDLPTRWMVRDTRKRGWHVVPADSDAAREIGGRPFEMAGVEGQKILDKFAAGVPYVAALTKLVQAAAEQEGFIRTISGRKRRFPRNPSTGDIEDAHKALNGLVQGSAGDQTKLAMVMADEAGIEMQLQVHDELDLTIYSDDTAKELEHIMVTAERLNVPSRTDIEVGPTWGEIK